MSNYYTRQTLEGRIVTPPQHHGTATPSCTIIIQLAGGECITCVGFNKDAERLKDADANDIVVLAVERVDDAILIEPGFALIERVVGICKYVKGGMDNQQDNPDRHAGVRSQTVSDP